VTNTRYQQSPDPELEAGQPAASKIQHFCQELVERMGLELAVAASENDGIVTVNLTGEDRSQLLSNTAALLNSIEYIVGKVFRTGKEAPIHTIVLDSDNYRNHRRAELVLLAEMAAKKVIAQRKSLTLQPMTPRERRIVHLALAEVGGVTSESDGEGDNRSITIFPASK
jgi:spoIIIJ-associated protein